METALSALKIYNYFSGSTFYINNRFHNKLSVIISFQSSDRRQKRFCRKNKFLLKEQSRKISNHYSLVKKVKLMFVIDHSFLSSIYILNIYIYNNLTLC